MHFPLGGLACLSRDTLKGQSSTGNAAKCQERSEVAGSVCHRRFELGGLVINDEMGGKMRSLEKPRMAS